MTIEMIHSVRQLVCKHVERVIAIVDDDCNYVDIIILLALLFTYIVETIV
jgi:hypothetical protein